MTISLYFPDDLLFISFGFILVCLFLALWAGVTQFSGLYVVLEIEFGLVAYKASTLPIILPGPKNTKLVVF